MNLHGKDIKIFAGNSNRKLAEEIAEKIGLPLGLAKVGKFSDGESAIHIEEVVRGSDVFIIQSTCPPANDNLVELLIMIDALKRASAGRITAVMPYFGYARQDRKAKARDPISAKLVANLITTAGADRILTMDLHAPQLQGFFDIPVDHLIGVPILANYFREKFKGTSDVVVVSPDVGSVSRSRKFAERLEVPLAIIDKRRPKANVSEIMNIIGDVNNKRVILVDDLIDTGGTIINAANALVEIGAKEVYACCTHGVLSGSAIEKIDQSPMKELVTLNTIPIPEEKRIPKIVSLSVAPVFAEAIERIYGDISISTLFTQQDES
ncbi:ribose-phosphate diphosphokinase [Acetivibrio clariflavus]|uniref:Ribose-phosphate pyrophosphokinase n=1 Tax=Acetivibrio clariflavus (strain DSM 19732 / NBRC 101661 / EBR45) TaxID=720554 RepID=G8M1Y1_ACECE|nr:ribose-phosphate diphosphokinase [Acetivibrio clariflavus]AEV67064.1 ribose-phosphate pyrophosphokinase [Acetivibrio clariflavus DSM 19732]